MMLNSSDFYYSYTISDSKSFTNVIGQGAFMFKEGAWLTFVSQW